MVSFVGLVISRPEGGFDSEDAREYRFPSCFFFFSPFARLMVLLLLLLTRHRFPQRHSPS